MALFKYFSFVREKKKTSHFETKNYLFELLKIKPHERIKRKHERSLMVLYYTVVIQIVLGNTIRKNVPG